MLVLAGGTQTVNFAHVAHKQGMTSGWAWLLTEERLGGKELAGWLWFRPFIASDMQAFAERVSKRTASKFSTTLSKASVDLTYSAALYDARVGSNEHRMV